MEIVKLNVGGKLFVTSKLTLLMDENSMLAAMFDPERGHCAIPLEDGSFFIDRDPKYFRPVLNYLRTNSVCIDSNISCSAVLEEAKYFNVIPMQLALFSGYQQDRFLGADFTQEQLQALHKLKQEITEGEEIHHGEVLSPASGVASAKEYREPTRVRAEITRKELVQIIAPGGIETRLRLSGVCFSYQDLSGLDLGNCNLTASDFSYCKLQRTVFYNSTLNKCCLRNANLQHVNCNSANLVGADLRNCDLRAAHFCHADLMAANFAGSIMDKSTQWNGASLRNVKGITPEQKILIKQQGGDI